MYADIREKLAQVESMRCNVTQLAHELVLSCFNNSSQVKYLRRCLDQGVWSLGAPIILLFLNIGIRMASLL